jgi:hypothetical protein
MPLAMLPSLDGRGHENPFPRMIRHSVEFEARVSDFLSSTLLHEISRNRLGHERGPESSSERVNPTKIYCRASPTHLDGSRGPGANPKHSDFRDAAEVLVSY